MPRRSWTPGGPPGEYSTKSTGTRPDPGGLECMLQDGDLQRWTRVDGLPADGMQEVWGSNPHSSTGQKLQFEKMSQEFRSKYSSKVQQ